MLLYVLRRLVLTIPLLLGVSFLVFVVVTSIPGDPCLRKLGAKTSPEALAGCRTALKLDRPFPERYAHFVTNAAQLDFGEDLVTGEDVGPVIMERLAPTVELTLVALFLAFILGTWIGTRSALRPGTWFDAFGQVVSLAGVSIPVFWLGLMLSAWLGSRLGWLPFSGWHADQIGPDVNYATGFYMTESLFRLELGSFFRALKHIALPAMTLATIPLATITRMTRSSVLEEVGQDYVTTARSKGLNERVVIGRHVRRNALIPVVTITGLQLGSLLSGAVLTETIFSWPGLGTHMVEAADARNYPVLIGCMMLFVVIFILVNLLVDVLYHWIDPRMRAASGV